MTFAELNLNPVLLAALPPELHTPTRIQQLAIPVALQGKDLLALAQTGSGKTLAFGLPLLHALPLLQNLHSDNSEPRDRVQALILVPTRELAAQVSRALQAVATPLGIGLQVLCGGEAQETQLEGLAKGPQLLVATPGRLLDLLKQDALSLQHVRHLVLDEADRLLEMGFWPDIQRLLTFMPDTRQTLLFSATLPAALNELALGMMTKPVRIEAQALNSVVAEIEERLYLVNKGSKAQALIALLKEHQWSQALVFIGARDSADALAKRLAKAGVAVASLHGDKAQAVRTQTLEDFKAGRVKVLVATDLLARGIHVDALPVVLNLDLPPSAPVYVHRIGRTARAGASGLAISLVCHGENDALDAIRTLTGRALPLQALPGFPVTDLPAAKADTGTGEVPEGKRGDGCVGGGGRGEGGERKRPPRDKQANRRSINKRSIKDFTGKSGR
ncbi:DEAD/DEAH box helicase [Shewanella salipaludis]|uniref:DEAD/DEAH box helicase n=1 Tax=Shewanella salipaludis TaxID=2723052 RepID=A0A972JLT3_9GAMM|nr:DEAD/DEAH box helicase [Shewanella salipaludis]NMH66519.1 DEAD/DEAH box helicase [Shewanella salipaludis]